LIRGFSLPEQCTAILVFTSWMIPSVLWTPAHIFSSLATVFSLNIIRLELSLRKSHFHPSSSFIIGTNELLDQQVIQLAGMLTETNVRLR
jgi:hypothetical protein